ncbi:MAG: tetratricopeptide repeat protein [Pirellulales bacterium]|nr:tetratricopeptide repeat protein [Pirellulales bacterium]
MDPDWFEEQLAAAQAAVEAEDFVRAAAIADQLAMDSPEHPQVRTVRAEALLHTGGADEALAEARRAAELSPLDPHAQRILGRAAWRRGRLTQAQDAFSSAIRFSDRAPPALTEYAWFMASQRGPKPAEQAARQAVAAAENSATAWAALGLAQYRLHRLAEAEESLRRALAIDPEDPNAQSVMVLLLQDRGKNAEAEILADHLEAHPGTEDLVESVRHEAKERRLAARLVVRHLDRPPPAAPPRGIWFVILTFAVFLGGVLLVAFPDAPLLILLCVTIPLLLGALCYWYLR